MATLTSDQIKVLEQSRQRLVQLTRSLGSLIASLNQSDPLPPWCAAPKLQCPTNRTRLTEIRLTGPPFNPKQASSQIT